MWRDLGYAAGALIAGVLADLLSVPGAIAAVGVLTIASGLGVALRLPVRPGAMLSQPETSTAVARE